MKLGIIPLATMCGVVATVGALFVAIAPVTYLILEHKVSVGWLIAGAVTWIFGVGIKGVGWFYLRERLMRLSSHNAVVAAGCSGLWSGIAELGATVAFFLWVGPPQSLLELVTFGLGAGLIEVLYILAADLSDHAGRAEKLKKIEGRALGALLPLWFILERSYATVFHTASRALTYLSLTHADPLPVLIGLAGFTLVDGATYYGEELQQWDWFDHRVIGLFHAFGLAVTAAVVLIWWALWFLKGYSI